MSMVKCARCFKIFDSDEDPECFMEGHESDCEGQACTCDIEDFVYCEPCREILFGEDNVPA